MRSDVAGLLVFILAAGLGIVRYVRPELRRWWAKRTCFVLLLFLALFASQHEAIRANFQLWNPDESEMLAGALTLQERPVFWRDVDGNSHGPLNQLPLLLPSLFGLRLDYTSARVVGCLMIGWFFICLHQVIATWSSEGTARLLVLPGWAFFIFNQDPEIAQYTTEMPSCLLIGLGLVFATRASSEPRASHWNLAWAGLCCGAAPFGKLQSTPMAASVLVLLFIHIAFTAQLPSAERWKRTGSLIAGASMPAAFFVGLAAIAGAFEYFRIAYIESNLLGYVVGGSVYFAHGRPVPGTIFGLNEFLWPMTGIVVAGTLAGIRYTQRINWPGFALATGLFAAALLAIYLPSKPFAHYFILLIGPLILLAGITAGPPLTHLARSIKASWLRLLLATAVILGPSVPLVSHHFRNPDFFRIILQSRPRLSRELVTALQRHTSPGEVLAVWGWQPALYVFTQTVSATRNLIVFWPAVSSRWQDFYQTTYLQDITGNPPAVFVDTMGPADFFFHQSKRTRHESFPALADYISSHYTLVETVADCRIYVRRDRKAPVAPEL
ncbi:MAG TPA: hypothetical protein VIM71_14310 [Lacunisphaera sp.]